MRNDGNGVFLGRAQEGKAGVLEMTSARLGDAPSSEYSPVIIQWLECAQSLGLLRMFLRFMSLHLFAFKDIQGHFVGPMDLTQTCELM